MSNFPDSEILQTTQEHVFWTWSAQAKVNPIPIKRAEGVYVWDIDDKRYLDFNSMTMCVNIGHGKQHVIEAMVKQTRELPYAAPGMATKIRAQASKMIAEITPGSNAVPVDILGVGLEKKLCLAMHPEVLAKALEDLDHLFGFEQ